MKFLSVEKITSCISLNKLVPQLFEDAISFNFLINIHKPKKTQLSWLRKVLIVILKSTCEIEVNSNRDLLLFVYFA